MRRLILIFGMLLTLTSGVWGSALAAAYASCMHEASAPSASGEHDCCRAKIAGSNTHHSESHDASHDASRDASHETSTAQNQPRESHAGMNCGGAGASPARESEAVAIVERGLSSCAECCVGGTGQTPATAVVVVPEQSKVKRAAGSDSACARDLFAPAILDATRLAPTQHAPPAPPGHRHILIGVFLI